MTRETAATELAMANRILVRHQVVDAFGHVSQRVPGRADRFLISRSLAPASVMPEDIVELDLDGESVEAGAPKSYLERFIHAEIYRARPDVMAIVHSHSPSVLPFSIVTGMRLRCVCHTAGFIKGETPVFEIRNVAGEASDLLIRNAALGRALAAVLGDKALVLMPGHGSTVVGASLAQAVFHAVYAEVNAKVQAEGLRLGAVTYFTAGECAATAPGPDAVDRAWAQWRRDSERELASERS